LREKYKERYKNIKVPGFIIDYVPLFVIGFKQIPQVRPKSEIANGETEPETGLDPGSLGDLGQRHGLDHFLQWLKFS